MLIALNIDQCDSVSDGRMQSSQAGKLDPMSTTPSEVVSKS